MIPQPGSPDAPNYWMNETSGVLKRPITRLCNGYKLSREDIGALKAYFKQWVDSPAWDAGPVDDEGRAELATLRKRAHEIQTAKDIRHWVAMATNLGMDPL